MACYLQVMKCYKACYFICCYLDAWSCLMFILLTTTVETSTLNICVFVIKCHLTKYLNESSHSARGADVSLGKAWKSFFCVFHFGTWHDNSKLTCWLTEFLLIYFFRLICSWRGFWNFVGKFGKVPYLFGCFMANKDCLDFSIFR
jgi:hypothetical protein